MMISENIFIPILLLLPNLLILAFEPTNIPPLPPIKKTFSLPNLLEKIGQAGVFTVPLFYPINLSSTTNQIAIVLLILSIGVYYWCCLRYFRGNKNYYLLFKPLGFLPLPMTASIITYLLCCTKLLDCWPMLLSTASLIIGHAFVSYGDYSLMMAKLKECSKQ
jgi:hypothetical protein